MNIDGYRRVLLSLQATLSARERRETAAAQAQISGSPVDAGEAAVVDEAISEDFSAAELDIAVLKQIGEALQRIEDGTYGRCLVDDGLIEGKRLDAVPWAAYCIKHQKLLEAASQPKPTL